jgi:hypothetical protein
VDALAAYSEKHAPTTKRPDLIGSAALKLAEFFGGKTCAAINATACTDYVAWRGAQKDARGKIEFGKYVSASTARRELVVLSAALRCAGAGETGSSTARFP